MGDKIKVKMGCLSLEFVSQLEGMAVDSWWNRRNSQHGESKNTVLSLNGSVLPSQTAHIVCWVTIMFLVLNVMCIILNWISYTFYISIFIYLCITLHITVSPCPIRCILFHNKVGTPYVYIIMTFLKGRDYLADLGVDGRIMLKWLLKK